MVAELSSETEKKIIEAATRVFLKKGKSGTSMQDIADEAGINRTSLNYYFRSKDKLFMLIFEREFLNFIPDIAKSMLKDYPIEKKFSIFIDEYISLLQKNPLTPVFILHELTTNPENLINLIKSKGIDPEYFIALLKKEMAQGNIRNMDPRQLVINLLSLIIFPIAARPVMIGIICNGEEEKYEAFLKNRKESLKEYFINSIKPVK